MLKWIQAHLPHSAPILCKSLVSLAWITGIAGMRQAVQLSW